MLPYMFVIALVLSPVAIEAVDPQSCASSDRMDCNTEHADLLPVDLMQKQVSLATFVTTKEAGGALADGVQWSISPQWSGSCDAVCSGLGSTCSQEALDDLGLSSSNKNPDALKQAFESATGADIACNSWNTGCSGGNCPNWGLPFIHSSHFNDNLCWGGDAAAPCGQVPVDGHHRRLCPCRMSEAASPTCADATSLIGDADFESNQLSSSSSPWKCYNKPGDTIINGCHPHENYHGHSTVAHLHGNCHHGTQGGIQQTVSTVAGKDYTLKFVAHEGHWDGADTDDVYVSIDNSDKNTWNKFSIGQNDGWKEVSLNFKADGPVTVKMWADGNNCIDVDDVELLSCEATPASSGTKYCSIGTSSAGGRQTCQDTPGCTHVTASAAECNAAATALGWGDTSASTETDSGRPHGCWINFNSYLVFNDVATTNGCNDSDECACVCTGSDPSGPSDHCVAKAPVA